MGEDTHPFSAEDFDGLVGLLNREPYFNRFRSSLVLEAFQGHLHTNDVYQMVNSSRTMAPDAFIRYLGKRVTLKSGRPAMVQFLFTLGEEIGEDAPNYKDIAALVKKYESNGEPAPSQPQ